MSKKTPLTKTVPTLIALVIDASGSMETCKAETITGFNNFIKEQKKLGVEDTTVSITFFNSYVNKAVENSPLNNINVLDESNYVPNGYTALLDAVSATIDSVSRDLGNKRAIVVIMTDGQENSSHTITNAQLKEKIEQKTAQGWEFIYLGANQDAFAEAHKYGISALNTSNYYADKSATAYASTSGAVGSLRSGETKLKADWKASLPGNK